MQTEENMLCKDVRVDLVIQNVCCGRYFKFSGLAFTLQSVKEANGAVLGLGTRSLDQAIPCLKRLWYVNNSKYS